jgi:transcriptional regulator with XRE-family HTH domain
VVVENSIDGEIARISARIRRWREEAGLTLQELANRSDLATSTVQKVETGQMIPSVVVLLKLSHGLGRRPSELIREGDADLDIAFVRASERDRTGHEKSMVIERLSGDLSDSSLEMWRVHLHPEASSGSAPIHYAGEELVVCEKGRVVFTIGDEEYDLDAGDSLHFKAHLPHSWRNRGRRVAVFTVTGTLPARFRAMLRSRVTGAA